MSFRNKIKCIDLENYVNPDLDKQENNNKTLNNSIFSFLFLLGIIKKSLYICFYLL